MRKQTLGWLVFLGLMGLLVGCGGGGGGGGDHAVVGAVVDDDTNAPVPGAAVVIGSAQAVTNANGEFRFDGMADGLFNLSVTKTGYVDYLATIQVTAEPVTTLATIRLVPTGGGGGDGPPPPPWSS